MFSRPYLEGEAKPPEPPIITDEFSDLLGAVGVDREAWESLPKLTRFARDNLVLSEDLQRIPGSGEPVHKGPAYEEFRHAGMIEAIRPRSNEYSTILRLSMRLLF